MYLYVFIDICSHGSGRQLDFGQILNTAGFQPHFGCGRVSVGFQMRLGFRRVLLITRYDKGSQFAFIAAALGMDSTTGFK